MSLSNKFSLEWGFKEGDKSKGLKDLDDWEAHPLTKTIKENVISARSREDFDNIIKSLMQWCFISGYIISPNRDLEREQDEQEKSGPDSSS